MSNGPAYGQPPPIAAPPRRKGGCGKGCAIGCLVAAILLVVAAVAGYFGIRSFLRKAVAQYTDTQPRALPAVTVTEAQARAAVERMKAFGEAVQAGRATEPLVLTADDINGMIRHNPEFGQLAGKVFITVEGSKVGGQVSVSLEEIMPGVERVRGRYLNGAATFTVQFGDGRLVVFLDTLEANGKRIPDLFLSQLRGKNLAEDAMKDPKVVEGLSKIDSISVADGRITIRPRAP